MEKTVCNVVRTHAVSLSMKTLWSVFLQINIVVKAAWENYWQINHIKIKEKVPYNTKIKYLK